MIVVLDKSPKSLLTVSPHFKTLPAQKKAI